MAIGAYLEIFCKNRGLTNRLAYDIMVMQGGGNFRKEGTPMSTSDVIALLMLVIAAISLGISLKK